MNRPVTWGEIACTLSHIGCWKKIANDDDIQDNDFCVIAEDDVRFIPNFSNAINVLINGLKNHPDNNLIILQKLGTRELIWKERLLLSDNIEIHKYPDHESTLYNHDGASLYLIQKSLTKHLLNELIDKKPYWLADSISEFHPSIKNIGITVPLLGYIPQNNPSDLEQDRKQARKYALDKEKIPL